MLMLMSVSRLSRVKIKKFRPDERLQKHKRRCESSSTSLSSGDLRKFIRSLEVSGNWVEEKKILSERARSLCKTQQHEQLVYGTINCRLLRFSSSVVAQPSSRVECARFHQFAFFGFSQFNFFSPFHNSKAFRRNSSKKVIVQLLFFGRVKEFLGSNKVWCRVCWIMQLCKTEKLEFHHYHHWTIRAPSVQKFDGLCRRGQVVGRLNIFRCWIIHESQRKVIITQLRDGIRRGNTNIHRRLYEIVTGH